MARTGKKGEYAHLNYENWIAGGDIYQSVREQIAQMTMDLERDVDVREKRSFD